jgi:hypothetical protein
MGIDTLRTEGRQEVAWFELDPPKEGCLAFERRGFQVRRRTRQELSNPSHLAGIRAVIFTQNPTREKLLQIGLDLQACAERLLDHDCRVILRPAPGRRARSKFINGVRGLRLPSVNVPPENEEELWEWQRNDDNQTPLPHLHAFDSESTWDSVANFVAEHPSGPAPNQLLEYDVAPVKETVVDKNVTIVNERRRFTPEAELLVSRAFSNCAHVHFVPMMDGRSGVSVYRAYAELEKSPYGRWPLPYFVKLGDRETIYREYLNYEEKVDPYVPFHLGPHLVRERCCLGACKGILVGDYVDESESLTSSACDGRAAPAISGLFDRTLHGWYRDAEEKQASLVELLGRFPRKIANTRLARAKELGLTLTIPELRTLFERCTSTPVLVGPIHGDLKAANIRVRAGDAIVIDFCAHRPAPLIYDAACLEASLLVDGFGKEALDAHAWMRSIEKLYAHVPLDRGPRHADPKNPSCWFFSCVRQIRLYAQQMERRPGQYAAALALALLRKAEKDNDALEPEATRRAAALVFAAQILSLAFGQQQAETA